jgi:hypothetical protein
MTRPSLFIRQFDYAHQMPDFPDLPAQLRGIFLNDCMVQLPQAQTSDGPALGFRTPDPALAPGNL